MYQLTGIVVVFKCHSPYILKVCQILLVICFCHTQCWYVWDSKYISLSLLLLSCCLACIVYLVSIVKPKGIVTFLPSSTDGSGLCPYHFSTWGNVDMLAYLPVQIFSYPIVPIFGLRWRIQLLDYQQFPRHL